MTALQTVTAELARLRAELEDLPADAFGRRADLRSRQQQLRAAAAELRRVEEHKAEGSGPTPPGAEASGTADEGSETATPRSAETDPEVIDIRDARDERQRLRDQQQQSTV